MILRLPPNIGSGIFCMTVEPVIKDVRGDGFEMMRTAASFRQHRASWRAKRHRRHQCLIENNCLTYNDECSLRYTIHFSLKIRRSTHQKLRRRLGAHWGRAPLGSIRIRPGCLMRDTCLKYNNKCNSKFLL